MHALLVAPDAVRPPGAFDGLRTHLGHPPLPAVYFSTLPAGDTGGELLPAGAAKFTGKDEQEVRALPPHGKGGKIYRRCRALVHVCPDPLQPTARRRSTRSDAHHGAPHSPCCLFESYGCHLCFQRRQWSRASCNVLPGAPRCVRVGSTRRDRVRSTWAEDTASCRVYARAASHSLTAPDRAGHCDAASPLGFAPALPIVLLCQRNRLWRRPTRAVR